MYGVFERLNAVHQARREVGDYGKQNSLGSAGFVLRQEGVPVPRDLHVDVPVQAHPYRPAGDMSGQSGDAREEHGAGLLAAEAPAHSLCPTDHLAVGKNTFIPLQTLAFTKAKAGANSV